jgi:predicted RNA binding protein YcfA (HicA-like mRNA interferase family)
MNAGLPAVTAKEVIRVATKVGFVLDRQKGSHAIYRRASDKALIMCSMWFSL